MDFKAILGISLVLVVLPLLVLWLIARIFRRKSSNNERDEYSLRFEERVLKPDFAALEAHFGCVMPKELKELYANKEEIVRDNFEVLTRAAGKKESSFVAFYMPADPESIWDAGEERGEIFAFANDVGGNCYLIDPRIPKSEILFCDHETGEFSKVAANLAEFLAAPRKTSDE